MTLATRSISTIQAKQPLTNTAYLLLGRGPIKIFNIEGNVNSTTGTNYYIQLLGTGAPVSGTTIPLYSRLAVPASYPTAVATGFSFTYNPTGLSTETMTKPFGGTVATVGENTLPVYVAISTTDTVYTAVNASTDVTVDVEENELENRNQTVVGDTVTGVSSLVVFADPSVSSKVTRVSVTNLVASAGFIYVFPYVDPVNGAIPWQRFPLDGTMGAISTFNFGQGSKPTSQDSNGTIHTGCYLYFSFSGTSYTLSLNTSYAMQAFYLP